MTKSMMKNLGINLETSLQISPPAPYFWNSSHPLPWLSGSSRPDLPHTSCLPNVLLFIGFLHLEAGNVEMGSFFDFDWFILVKNTTQCINRVTNTNSRSSGPNETYRSYRGWGFRVVVVVIVIYDMTGVNVHWRSRQIFSSHGRSKYVMTKRTQSKKCLERINRFLRFWSELVQYGNKPKPK